MKRSKRIIALLTCIVFVLGVSATTMAETFRVPDGATHVSIPVWLTTRQGAFAGAQFTVEGVPGFDSVRLELSSATRTASLISAERDGKHTIGFYSAANNYAPGAEMSIYLGNVIFDYSITGSRTINFSAVKVVRVVDKDTTSEEYPLVIPHTIQRAGGGTGSGTYTTAPIQIGDMSIPFSGVGGISYAPFINGYPDGTFQPDGNLTRAELAQILYNMYGNNRTGLSTTYTDVQSSQWFHGAVAFCQDSGYLIGYPDGTFLPNQRVTRAELSTAITRLKSLTLTATHPFSDVGNHWGREYIGALFQAGNISGYPDGSFRPNNDITRAEAVTIICRAENRDQSLFDSGRTFTDLSTSHWAYQYIMNAANGYNYNN